MGYRNSVAEKAREGGLLARVKLLWFVPFRTEGDNGSLVKTRTKVVLRTSKLSPFSK